MFTPLQPRESNQYIEFMQYTYIHASAVLAFFRPGRHQRNAPSQKKGKKQDGPTKRPSQLLILAAAPSGFFSGKNKVVDLQIYSSVS